MTKLTKTERATLREALRHAERAQAYIMKADTVICSRSTIASTTLHYSRADGKALQEMAKEYGSDLCGLADSIRILGNFLATH